MVFEKLTEDASKVLAIARSEASRCGSKTLDVQHVLVGLLLVEKGIACKALRKSGLQFQSAREHLGLVTKDGQLAQADDVAVSEKVEELLALSNDFAIDRGRQYIDTEHLLFALLEIKNWHTRDVFDSAGVDLDRLRADVDILVDQKLELEVQADVTAIASGALTSEERVREMVGQWPVVAKSFLQEGRTISSDDRFFDYCDEDAVDVIFEARDHARKLGYNFVGSEQLLLGVIADRGLAGVEFKYLGIKLKDAQREVLNIIGRGSGPNSGSASSDITFTPRAKKVLFDMIDIAFLYGAQRAGAVHILLAIIDEGGGVASRVLENLEVDTKKLKENLLRDMAAPQD